MAIEYFSDTDGNFKEFSAIWIKGYKKPESFPANDAFTEIVFNETLQWLTVAVPQLGRERLTQIAYDITLRVDTTRHIINTHQSDSEWNEIITDYIEAMVYAFKKTEIGLPCYLQGALNLVSTNDDLSEEQKTLLAYYINSHKGADNNWPLYSNFDFFDATTLSPIDQYDSPKELIVMGNQQKNGEGHLIGTFQKWLKIFPFELGCFKHDKQYLTQRFSDFIANGNERTNRFLELSFRQTKTTSEFISFLIDTTKEMLHDVDSISWTESADPSDIKSRQLALIRHSHRIKQEKLLAEFNDGEKVYVKVLKEWLKNEKKFFEELTTCLPKTDDKKILPKVLGTVPEFFPMTLVGKLHGYCNEQQFELESIDLYQILNTPDKWEKPAKVKKGEIGRMEYLMSKINEYLEKRNAPSGLFASICRASGLNPQNCFKRGKLPEDFYKVNEKYMEQIQMILSSETN